VAVQRGVVTSQEIPHSGRIFIVEDTSGPACFQDRWGEWVCGHDHSPSLPLQDAYQYSTGWTVQERL